MTWSWEFAVEIGSFVVLFMHSEDEGTTRQVSPRLGNVSGIRSLELGSLTGS